MTTVRVSDGQISKWASGNLKSEGAVTAPTRPPQEAPTVRPTAGGRRPRRASAVGTTDKFCHVLVAGFGYTRCGKRINPPLAARATHLAPPAVCPGGHPPCPECAA